MLDYLRKTLGLEASEEPWSGESRLPLYLRGQRSYSVLTVEGNSFLVIWTDAGSFNLAAFQKQMDRLARYWSGPFILCFERLTAYQRRALITHHLCFIVPGSQLYLPCLGIALQERMPAPKRIPFLLTPSAQYLFLHILYRTMPLPATKTSLARVLDMAPMDISRGVEALTQMKLITVEHIGRSDYVSPACPPQELFRRAVPHLIDPVQKRLSVRWRRELETLPLSGETALSRHSLLNPPLTECRAIGRKAYRELPDMEPVDPAWQTGADHIQLEVWRYDPLPLARGGTVDPASLSRSLKGVRDERVEQSVNDMLEGYPW